MPPNLAILALAARKMFAKRIDFRKGVGEDADHARTDVSTIEGCAPSLSPFSQSVFTG